MELARETSNGFEKNEGVRLSPAESIDNVLKESAAAIRAEEPKPVKRKRGRPRKYSSAESVSVPHSASTQEIEPAAQVNLTSTLQGGLKIIGEGFAQYFSCEKLRISEDESLPVAESANIWLADSLPALDKSPHAKFYMVLITAGILASQKTMIYFADKAEKEKERKEKKEVEKKPEERPQSMAPGPIFPTTHVGG